MGLAEGIIDDTCLVNNCSCSNYDLAQAAGIRKELMHQIWATFELCLDVQINGDNILAQAEFRKLSLLDVVTASYHCTVREIINRTKYELKKLFYA